MTTDFEELAQRLLEMGTLQIVKLMNPQDSSRLGIVIGPFIEVEGEELSPELLNAKMLISELAKASSPFCTNIIIKSSPKNQERAYVRVTGERLITGLLLAVTNHIAGLTWQLSPENGSPSQLIHSLTTGDDHQIILNALGTFCIQAERTAQGIVVAQKHISALRFIQNDPDAYVTQMLSPHLPVSSTEREMPAVSPPPSPVPTTAATRRPAR